MTPLPERLATAAARRPATLGRGRLVCVDGPAGSGKTTLATALATILGGAPVVHMDDLYPGWDGLPEVGREVLGLLGPLADGRPGCYRRYDWYAGRFAEQHCVAPGPWLVLEGVGSGQSAWAGLTTLLVWVEVPDDLRLQRGIARDGEAERGHWVRWMADERAHFVRDGTRERADVLVDGTSSH
ncbi:MAG TPA: 4-amino-4-deoxy-L-arabinose transferase [Marmoricola sp.]|nr:4-amino-4-deoxy-L-arabinose transferase [Marmoricola sp.]